MVGGKVSDHPLDRMNDDLDRDNRRPRYQWWLGLRPAVGLVSQDGRDVAAVGYVIRRDHEQYAGGLELTEQARMIARAEGGRGPNAEYLFNTVRHLNQMGVEDLDMDALARQVRLLLQSGDAGQ